MCCRSTWLWTARNELLKPNPAALIIDGDRASRRLLRAVLEPAGYRTFEVETGAEALKEAIETNPDVITLELELPDTDGISVLQIRDFFGTENQAVSVLLIGRYSCSIQLDRKSTNEKPESRTACATDNRWARIVILSLCGVGLIKTRHPPAFVGGF